MKKRFDEANFDAEYPSHVDVNADAYVDAMKRAGFQNIEVVDKSEEYRKHHLAVLSRIRDEVGEPDS